MNQKLHDFLALKVIPALFKLRGGDEIWPDAYTQSLSHYGIESICMEDRYEVEFKSTYDWNSLPVGLERTALPSRVLPAEKAEFRPSYVYRLDRETFGDCTKRYGVIVLPGARPLMTGFSRQRFHLATLIPRNPFKIRRENLILCPQPYPGGTYGDVLNVTLPRLCSILMSLSEKEKAEACVAMPFANEITHKLVEKLGISRDRHIDSRCESFGLTRSGVAVTCNTPLKIHVPRHAYHYMRTMLCPQHTEEGNKRIYIQRQFSRKIIGEENFIPQLKDMGFEIFDDTPRSLEEQMDIFHGAEVIVCAHGAGQVNMLWANPHVRVLELRDAGLWHNCFRLWSHYNGARHELMVDWSRSSVTDWRLDCAYEDLKTTPAALMRAVSSIV